MCLEKAVEQDPYNLDALAALGVSYVNEGNQTRALSTLRVWRLNSCVAHSCLDEC